MALVESRKETLADVVWVLLIDQWGRLNILII